MARRKEPTKPCGYRGRLIADITRQLDAATMLEVVVRSFADYADKCDNTDTLAEYWKRVSPMVREHLDNLADALGRNGLQPDEA